MRRTSICAALFAACAITGPAWSETAPPAVVTIASPANEQTIHDNAGRVPVRVALDAPLLQEGATLQAVLDDMPAGEPKHERSFTLDEVNRGEHTLRVLLLDQSGKPASASPAVTFYMWQASTLF